MMKLLPLFFIGIIASVTFAATSSATQLYLTALQNEQKSGPNDLEKLYHLANSAAQETLNLLDSNKAEEVKDKIPGLLLNKETSAYAMPDPKYFYKLSEKKGAKNINNQFFKLLEMTYQSAPWPVYIQQQTDESGCTLFDLDELPNLYYQWLNFQTQYPLAYKVDVKHEIDKMNDQLLTSTCACGKKDSVLNGLQALAKKLDYSPAGAQFKKRLQAIKSGSESDMRYECIAG